MKNITITPEEEKEFRELELEVLHSLSLEDIISIRKFAESQAKEVEELKLKRKKYVHAIIVLGLLSITFITLHLYFISILFFILSFINWFSPYRNITFEINFLIGDNILINRDIDIYFQNKR